jgi:hypothetical protein
MGKKKKRFKLKTAAAKSLRLFKSKIIPNKPKEYLEKRERRIKNMIRKVKERKPEWDYD